MPVHFSKNLFLICLPVLTVLIASCKTAKPHNQEADDQGVLADAENGERIIPKFAQLQNRMSWLESISYKSLGEVPTEPSPGCEIVNFVIQVPPTTLTVGHAAVAIGQDFYDYGPKDGVRKLALEQTSVGLTRLRTPVGLGVGAPWWGWPDRLAVYSDGSTGRKWPEKYVSPKDVDFPSVLDYLPTLAGGSTVMIIPMEINADHANRMRGWWEEVYADFPEYRIPGNQCTSAVIRSFEETESTTRKGMIAGFFTDPSGAGSMSPLMWAAKLLDNNTLSWNRTLNYRHRCGVNKGKVLKAAVVQVGTDIKASGGDKFLIDPKDGLRAKIAKLSKGAAPEVQQ